MRWMTMLGLMGCGAVNSAALTPWEEPTQVLADDFDRSCEVAEDCVAVIEQGNCGQCGNAASIAFADEEHWHRVRERRAENCTWTIFPGCPQLDVTVGCEDELCVVVSEQVVEDPLAED